MDREFLVTSCAGCLIVVFRGSFVVVELVGVLRIIFVLYFLCSTSLGLFKHRLNIFSTRKI